jgi:small subunit ribosomal protein S9
MAEEQPPAEGDDVARQESSADAPEVSAEQAGTEGDAPAEQPAPEEAAPVEAAAPEEPAAEEPAAPEEPAPAAAEAPADEPAAEEPAVEEPAAEEAAPAEEPAPAAAEAPADEPAAEEPAADTPAPVEAAAPDEPAADEPAADAPAPAAAEAGAPEPRRQRPPQADATPEEPTETVVPGAHLEPDLVLEESRPAEGEFDPYATDDDSPVAEGEEGATVEETPAPERKVLDLAADARYRATGKRKRAIARVILKPGQGVYTINGKELDTYFPRVTLQKNARLPLETAGYETRMDVIAKIHGGGVSSQAIALRHGISRALVEADPNLRTELKRQGFLTRDARVKERKKAGLKKARKRPQFSKR